MFYAPYGLHQLVKTKNHFRYQSMTTEHDIDMYATFISFTKYFRLRYWLTSQLN